MESRVLLLLGGVFALGAGVLVLVGLIPSRRALAAELWRLYLLEILIVGLVILPAHAGPVPFLAAACALALGTQAELVRLLLPECPGRLRAWLGAGAVTLLVAAHLGGDGFLWRLPVTLVLSALVGDIFTAPCPYRSGWATRGALVTVFPVMFVGYLVMLRNLPHGFLLVAFLYTVVETCDSFALLCGKLGGRTKAFPTLSPGKTRAGVVGGLVSGGLVGVLFGVAAGGLPLAVVLPVTAAVLVTTVLGDLAASKIKRNLGIKDFGDAVPTHGGVLDVYDTLIVAAPVFFWLIRALAA